jgi:DNA adenine methylase
LSVAVESQATIVKYHGGKRYLRRKIGQVLLGLAQRNNRTVFCDGTVGGGSILLEMCTYFKEVFALDTDPDVINFWSVLQNSPEDFRDRLLRLEYSQGTYEKYLALTPDPDDSETQADRFFVLQRMSRGGLRNGFAWSNRTRGGKPGDLNAWQKAIERIPAVSEQIQHVEFWEEDIANLLFLHASDSEAIFYLDPPYLPPTRKTKKAYQKEMTVADHQLMLGLANGIQGSVAISGYDSPLYRKFLTPELGWSLETYPMPNHSGQNKKKQARIEHLWFRD